MRQRRGNIGRNPLTSCETKQHQIFLDRRRHIPGEKLGGKGFLSPLLQCNLGCVIDGDGDMLAASSFDSLLGREGRLVGSRAAVRYLAASQFRLVSSTVYVCDLW